VPWPSSTTLSTHRCALADHKHSLLSLPRVSDSSRSDTGGVVVRAGGLAQHAVGSPPWNGRRHPALRPLGAEELCCAAAGVRLAEAVPADDAARRELALLGVRRVAREAAAQRSGASAKRLSSLSATTASFSAQPRGCAAGVDQRFDVVPLQRPVGGAFAVVCVCVSCAVCAHASPVGSLCVRAPVSYQS
jgi:hypothetical protein